MKNTRIIVPYYRLCCFILYLLLRSTLLSATEDVICNLKFRQLSAPHSLPTNEVQKYIRIKMDLSGSLPVMGFVSTMDTKPLFISLTFILRVY